MPRSRIVDVLAEVFRTYGFDTTSPAHPEAQGDGTVHRVDLLAEKDGTDVAVKVHEMDDPLSPEDVHAHARLRSAIGARYALAATLQPLAAATARAADQTGTLLWDREAIARAIGRAVLLEATGAAELDEPPVADLLAIAAEASDGTTVPDEAPMPADLAGFLDLTEADAPAPAPTPAVTPPPRTAATADAAASMESGRGWYLQTSPPPPERTPARAPVADAPDRRLEQGREWFLETNPPPPERAAAPAPTPARQPAAAYAAPSARAGIPASQGPDPHTFAPPEGVLLAPAVGKDKAAGTARRQVFTIDNTRLRYDPKRVVRWQVEAFVEGRVETTTLSGTLLVDLAARTVAAVGEWAPPRALSTGTFDVPVEGKPMRLRAEHAQELVSEAILEETSREVTLRDQDASGDFQITVKRRVRVSPEDVRIDDGGLHWFPVWCFTGVNGEVEVDGIDGAVVAAHLKGPKGATMLW